MRRRKLVSKRNSCLDSSKPEPLLPRSRYKNEDLNDFDYSKPKNVRGISPINMQRMSDSTQNHYYLKHCPKMRADAPEYKQNVNRSQMRLQKEYHPL